MEPRPIISIVMPVRNRSGIVGRTLASFERQALRPLEVVIVDNGSTDGTYQVLERWRDRVDAPDFQVKLLREMKPGACVARNRGLEAVTGRYVMHFDSDDLMAPDHCVKVADVLISNGYPHLVYWPVRRVELDGTVRHTKFAVKDLMFNHIFHAVLATPRFVVATEVIHDAGCWNETLAGWDDWELGVRLILASRKTSGVDLGDTVTVYCQVDSITGTSFSDNPDRWEVAMDTVESILRSRDMQRECRWVDMRRVILAGHYRQEGAADMSRRLMAEVLHHTGPMRRLIYMAVCRYVAAGGRGVAEISKILDR